MTISDNLQHMENVFLIAFVLIIFFLTNKSLIHPNIIPKGTLARNGILASKPVDVMLNE